MPKISVIIPAYNAELTIQETIASVQQQTVTDLEIIVINDGSTDRTLDILQSIDDSRLKVFSYLNAGLSTARNRGIFQANGEFIAFLDADDLWTVDKLELQLAALLQHPESGVAYSWTYFMNEKAGYIFPGDRLFFKGNVYADLLVRNFIASGSNPLIRKDVIDKIGGFNPKYSHFADWDYWLQISQKYDFVVVPQYQIFYRQSSQSMSSKLDGIKEAGCTFIQKLFQNAPDEYQYLKNQTLSIFYKYCADLYLQHSSDIHGINKAGYNLWLSIYSYPNTLIYKDTLKLLSRFIFQWLFPRKIADNLLGFLRNIRKISQQQLTISH
jgi:glycosyltransferase involved in cell wall biosynthesis